MVARHRRLLGRVGGIGRGREALLHLVKRVQRLLGLRLVALHVVDLLILRDCRQVIGIGRIAVAGMQGDETLRRVDGVVIGVALIVGKGLHQQGLGGKLRIGIFPLHLGEFLGGLLVGAFVQVPQALVIELGHGGSIARRGHVRRQRAARRSRHGAVVAAVQHALERVGTAHQQNRSNAGQCRAPSQGFAPAIKTRT